MSTTPTDPTAAVPVHLDASSVLLAGPAAATELEIASLLLNTSAALLALTSTAIEVLAVLGVAVWVVALLVLVAGDVSRAAQRRRRHQHGRKRQRRLTQHHWWVRR